MSANGWKGHSAIAAYYPETNGLLPLSYHDRKSKTPSAKSIPVIVRPMAGQGAAPP